MSLFPPEPQLATAGYCVKRGLYSKSRVAEIGNWIEALTSAPSPLVGRYYERGNDGSPVLMRAENLLSADPASDALVITDEARAIVQSVLGERPRVFKDKVNFKPARGRGDRLHQDQAAGWSRYCDLFVTMCIVIDENTLDNGAISFAQKQPKHTTLLSDAWHPLASTDMPYAPLPGFELVLAQPGDVIFLDSYVPHGSPPNRSGGRRRNYFVTFNRAADGDQRAAYYRDKWAEFPPNTPETARDPASHRV